MTGKTLRTRFSSEAQPIPDYYAKLSRFCSGYVDQSSYSLAESAGTLRLVLLGRDTVFEITFQDLDSKFRGLLEILALLELGEF
ncbi:unnamed protein product [Clonostachys rosea]|uniref:Uncharacterized protein n=1 Tax=Bionectria ochroleuca TaxID=29856 RepID=A0ABY6USI0_BIOOC|nr:unnamed protein product [Clonostachys rosea]